MKICPDCWVRDIFASFPHNTIIDPHSPVIVFNLRFCKAETIIILPWFSRTYPIYISVLDDTNVNNDVRFVGTVAVIKFVTETV